MNDCVCEESYYELDERMGILEDKIDDRIDIDIGEMRQTIKSLKKENKFIKHILKKIVAKMNLDYNKLIE